MNPRTGFAFRAGILLFYGLSTAGPAAEIRKANNNIDLGLSGCWQNGIIPGANDVMVWDSLVTATYQPFTGRDGEVAAGASLRLPILGADRSVAGIRVADVGGDPHVDRRVVGFETSSPVRKLTLGSSGIDLSAATQALFMQAEVLIGADQTWSISDANFSGSPAYFDNSEDLAIQAPVSGTLFDLGARTVTTTGPGQATITSGYHVTHGRLEVGNSLFVIQGGTGRVTNLASDLDLRVNSGGRLRLQSNSGVGGNSLVSAAPVTVNHGGTLAFRNLNMDFSLTHAGPITLNDGALMAYEVNSAGLMSVSGNITVAGNATLTVSNNGNPPGGIPFSGKLLGSGHLLYQNSTTTTASNSPKVHMSGDNKDFEGKITINGSTGRPDLRLTSSTAGSAKAIWRVNDSDDLLEVHGVSVQLGTLEGAGRIQNSSTSTNATLNIGQGEFSGTIEDGQDPLAVNKVSGGTLTLNGTLDHDGGTTVSAGTLILNGTATYGGGTNVTGGTLIVNTILGGTMTVGAAGTLGGIGPLDGTATIHGAISPGEPDFPVDTLVSRDPLSFAPGSDFIVEIGNWEGTTPGTDWDYLDVNGTVSFNATSANKLLIHIVGPPFGFTETAKVLRIAEGNSISGFDVAEIGFDLTDFVGSGTWTVRRNTSNNNIIEVVYAPASVTPTPYESWAMSKGLTQSNRAVGMDPDGDGQTNQVEFALNGNPRSGSESAQIFGKVAPVGGNQVLTITLPVRSTAAFTGSTDKSLAVDGMIYRVQASDNLGIWNTLVVTEVTGADATNIRQSLDLPASSGAWTYRTFRSPGAVPGESVRFLRVVVD